MAKITSNSGIQVVQVFGYSGQCPIRYEFIQTIKERDEYLNT